MSGRLPIWETPLSENSRTETTERHSDLTVTEGDEVWLQTRIAKTTVASQLAQDTADKKKRTWQGIIPERYHCHGKVFQKKLLNASQIVNPGTTQLN